MSDAAVLSLISGMFINNYCTVAFVTLLCYDYCLTFSREVEFIWKQNFNMGKVLFFFNRYVPILNLIGLMNSYVNRSIHDPDGKKFCAPFFHIDSWVGFCSIFVVNLLLLIRTYAIWRKSKVILVSLSILLTLCMMATAGATIYADVVVQSFPVPGNVRPCATGFDKTDVLYAIWVSSILWDTSVLILSLMKIVPLARTNVIGTRMVDLLIKDGVQYFAVLFLISISNVIVLELAPPALKIMLFTFYRVMLSILGSRIILNLRGTILKEHDEAITHESLKLVVTVKSHKSGNLTSLSPPLQQHAQSTLSTFDESPVSKKAYADW